MEPHEAASDNQVGQSIYRDGRLASGLPVRATALKGVPLSGADVACVKCHRRSGLGGSEGQNTIRPITGKLLFSQVLPADDRWRAIPAAIGAERPVYSQATLARALREGIDSTGRTLDALMPRYTLSDADIAQLHAYLQALSLAPAPGVTDKEIHFATIVTPEVHPDRSHAMLEVLQAFFSDKNGGTRQEARRRELPRKTMYRAYRTWVLHPWVLSGAPETWYRQLAERYRQQPVFAVIGGTGDGSWQPVHAFCNTFEVPCIFPDVDYPDVTASGYYSLYFTRGVLLEAEVLAKHLLESDQTRGVGTVVQIYRDDAIGHVPAQALRDLLQGEGGKTVIDYPLTGTSRMPANYLAKLSGYEHPYVLVIWLDAAGLDLLGVADAPPAGVTAIYVSASLSALRRPDLPESWISNLRMIYPFELPTRRNQRLARTKAWINSKNIPFIHERTLSNTFFAATITGEAMSHMGENFSRDYLIERIEQMTQSAPSPSIYPHLSLGPGQRFASKGSYVVRFSIEEGAPPVAISEWIVAPLR